MKHFLIFRKNIQCRTRWMINRAANIKLVLLCMVTHWLRVTPRYVDQPLPRPTTGGENKIQDKPGDKGQDKGDEASDIHECVDGYPFHGNILNKSFEATKIIKTAGDSDWAITG
jgi:hypothetical protein